MFKNSKHPNNPKQTDRQPRLRLSGGKLNIVSCFNFSKSQTTIMYKPPTSKSLPWLPCVNLVSCWLPISGCESGDGDERCHHFWSGFARWRSPITSPNFARHLPRSLAARSLARAARSPLFAVEPLWESEYRERETAQVFNHVVLESGVSPDTFGTTRCPHKKGWQLLDNMGLISKKKFC